MRLEYKLLMMNTEAASRLAQRHKMDIAEQKRDFRRIFMILADIQRATARK